VAVNPEVGGRGVAVDSAKVGEFVRVCSVTPIIGVAEGAALLGAQATKNPTRVANLTKLVKWMRFIVILNQPIIRAA
jgi:hypothetical protein